MNRVQAATPGKFLVFLLVVALVFAYIATKWDDFMQQSALYDGSLEDVALDEGAAAGEGAEVGEGGAPQGMPSGGAEGEAAGEETGQGTLPGEGSFDQLRVERTAIYDRQIEQLHAIANDTNASTGAREQAQQALVQITQRQGVEQQIEQLIRSKGYEDAVVFVYDQAAIVVVKADQFAQADAARIADIVRQVTGIGYEGIRIMTRDS